MQFKAGYIVDSIADIITKYTTDLDKHTQTDKIKIGEVNGLLQYVSSFDVEFPYEYELDFSELHPVLATINNIITRGLPTRAPVLIENLFSEIGLIEDNTAEFELKFPNLTKPISFELIFDLLHIIEPNLVINKNNYGGNLGSNLEWAFINKNPFLTQILESQRDFSTINNHLVGGRSVDFSFTSPYLCWNEKNQRNERISRIFEIDGPHHKLSENRYFDSYRDAIAKDENFETIRFTQATISEDDINLEALIEKKIYQTFKRNYERKKSNFLVEYSILFIPIAVARIQKTIIEILLSNPLLFKKESLSIGIIERDLPCGALAIKSLQEYFFNINELIDECDKLILPDISLSIFENPEWVINNAVHLGNNLKDESFFKKNDFDIIIDHSILRRSKIFKENDFKNEYSVKIRSSHYYDTTFGKERRVYCSNLLDYKELVTKKEDGSFADVKELVSSINFFIQNIFRKVSFREGQLPIISRALQQKPVIGLLPTGGGKSLSFQLPAFLQPGLCLIIDPIKSLMEDQVRVLKENWIDNCDYINSNLRREEKVQKLVDFRYGETMFLFVSPERLVMDDFRSIISTINQSNFGLTFSYCVIDEVHCVSEWGHDFRTTYLMLGKNAQTYTKTKSGDPVTLIGLTATASFDVLADIERELQIKHDDVANAIIMIENTIRPELFYRTIDVTGLNRIDKLNTDFQQIGFNLSKYNNDDILVQSLAHHYIEFENLSYGEKSNDTGKYILSLEGISKIEQQIKKVKLESNIENKKSDELSSIIFCPTKGNRENIAGEITDRRGVPFVFRHLNVSHSKGFYYASDIDAISHDIQKNFELFLADKIKHMICTKAFGMGIDKTNIRSTYHYYYSSSLESLIQEAGRSGRDKKISEASILVSTQRYYKVDIYRLFNDNKEHNFFKNTFTRTALRRAFEQIWANDNYVDIIFSTLKDLLDKIELTDFSLLNAAGKKYNTLSQEAIDVIRGKIKEKDQQNNYKYIIEKFEDRDIHDFFYNNSFKGVDTEISQFLNLFKIREFQTDNDDVIYIENQDTLENTFEKCPFKTFDFLITSIKRFPKVIDEICLLLRLNPDANPQYRQNTNRYIINKYLNYSFDINDFLFRLEEDNVINAEILTNEVKEHLKFIYNRNRDSSNDTGRLIYRMQSMGFLIDYKIDYNANNLYKCTFRKLDTIDEYLKIIEDYFRRYLSENSAKQKIEILRNRLNMSSLINNILECLFFLTEFSYNEIASKRKRATNEIESILVNSITDPNLKNDGFQQNLYLKEQIYFYFNAKYARLGFKIAGNPFSLLEDYQEQILSKNSILEKYLEIMQSDGTEQNNYKHMMGSCKKILRSLSDTDLKNDWLLRLLKAFSMYSINNASYISEANTDLELGFDNLYRDEDFHSNNFNLIEPIFELYFQKLLSVLQDNNKSFNDIKLIRNKLLLKMQTLNIEKLLIKNQELKEKFHAKL